MRIIAGSRAAWAGQGPRRSRIIIRLAALALLVGACKAPHGGGGGGLGDASAALPPGATPVDSSWVTAAPTAAPPVVAAPGGSLSPGPISFAPIAKAADPSVVTINTVATEVEVSPFTHRRRQALARGLGTGFVVDAKNGIILTNNHVIENAQEIEVQLSDQRHFPGKVVGTDPRTDIAVVRIEAKGLRPLPLGDSDNIEVGDWVVAIGNPFGLSHTVSAGIISAKGRTQQDVPLDPAGMYDFLQTDASINPGNSGGPLLNLKGEVVGMNSAIRGGGAQGIGFAIPMNMIKQLLPMLLRDGHVTRSALGVNILDVHELGPDDREAVGLTGTQSMNGAVIAGVSPGGPADRAGLAPGDIIVGFDGTAIDRKAQLQWLASTAGVGRTVTLRVERSGKLFDQRVILGQLQDAPVAPRQ